MGIQAKPEAKFEMIHEALMQPDNMLKVTVLCDLAGVSRSGYYRWCANEVMRQQREDADRRDFDLVLAAYKFRGYDKGAEGIHMRLLHQGIIMNVKKVRRLMRKYGLKCPIRQPNPYKQMSRAIKTSHVASNLVNREFGKGPRKVLLTDITYLFYNGHKGRCFLSTILDACTHEILAYQLSQDLKVDFVLDTVEKLIKKHGATLDNETIVHSDQGSHYTSFAFIQKLKDANFVQSMSRRGNCWDNAPQESFFGHMKDHIEARIADMTEYEQVAAQVDDYIDYYNNDAGQMSLKKLTPSEYYKYLQTGKYPLPVWNKRSDNTTTPKN